MKVEIIVFVLDSDNISDHISSILRLMGANPHIFGITVPKPLLFLLLMS